MPTKKKAATKKATKMDAPRPRECDSVRQLDFRAHMLMHDSLYGKYFVAK
jgi:hypothetical protein